MMSVKQSITEDSPIGDEGESHENPAAGGSDSVSTYLKKYGDSLRRYAGDTSIWIEVITEEKRGKDQPESWAIDLEKGTIYADSKWFTDRGYTLSESSFAIRHEVEHFRELRDLLGEPDGYKIWRQHRARSKADRGLFVLDDILDNIRVDRAVKERTPTLRDIGTDLRPKI